MCSPACFEANTERMLMNQQFLPICRADMLARGWQDVDFVVVMGDAYVDHPSFGSAIIARLLEKEGWRVGIISQPAYHTCESMKEYLSLIHI